MIITSERRGVICCCLVKLWDGSTAGCCYSTSSTGRSSSTPS